MQKRDVNGGDLPKATPKEILELFATNSLRPLIEILQCKSANGLAFSKLLFAHMDSLRVNPYVQDVAPRLFSPFRGRRLIKLPRIHVVKPIAVSGHLVLIRVRPKY